MTFRINLPEYGPGAKQPAIMLPPGAELAALRFIVPLLPPSVNHYKVRRFFNSAEARAFVDAVCIFSRKLPVSGVFYSIEICYYLAPERIKLWDVDNFTKVSLDALKVAGVIRDDRYVLDLQLRKRQSWDRRDERTEYIVTGVDGDGQTAESHDAETKETWGIG